MPDLVDLLLEVLQDPAAYRRFIGRLRPKLVGRPHPKRRLARLSGSLIRPSDQASRKMAHRKAETTMAAATRQGEASVRMCSRIESANV